MTRAQEQAIARVCAKECMQRELVEALKDCAGMLEAACMIIRDNDARAMAKESVAIARHVLARAKEQSA
ncbi:hypothetical protein E5S69_31660 [Cupriavidus necator]|uniref:hypothetical protein n=1 Tax=Cupriavidus necator TaxID=106590 RepID=UPI00149056B9|nr:hypothetical protein [Cupriavidus necator]NOV28045.1 hypothetical protein [Cupriavidus necator]